MGQGHSTAEAGTGVSSERKDAKKDYYELLDVEQNASPEEFVPINKSRLDNELTMHWLFPQDQEGV
jgi:hypothetical protein